jgi:hypothetical protein
MSKLNVLIFATCQGVSISKFLTTNAEFNAKFQIIGTIRNYEQIHVNSFIIDTHKNLIDAADVFIYQPLSDKFSKNNTDYIKAFLKPSCVSISIPYVYNLSLWPIFVTSKGDVNDQWENRDAYIKIYKNAEVIDALLAQNLSLDDILNLYDNEQIDFNYADRYHETMNILKHKDSICDVNVHDFIENNFKDKRLFLSASHPTSPVYVHMANQILGRLGLFAIADNFDMDYAQTSSPTPIELPTSSVSHFNFTFTTKEEEVIANKYYRKIITDYINSKI